MESSFGIDMASRVKPIASVQGASGAEIRRLFQQLAERWRADWRLAGALEWDEGEHGDGGSTCLRSITGADRYQLFQDLGRDSTACGLLPEGPVLAGEAVRRDITRGCDLVLLSKFGKLEAENGSGLIAAFVAAIEAGIPVLTSVAPRFDEAWSRFADPFFQHLPPDADAITAWWEAVRKDRVD